VGGHGIGVVKIISHQSPEFFSFLFLPTIGLCVSVALDDLLVGRDPLDNLCVLANRLLHLGHGHLLLVVGQGLHPSLCLQGLYDVLVLPADLMREAAQGAELKEKLSSYEDSDRQRHRKYLLNVDYQ
jgi:hypothetical protein